MFTAGHITIDDSDDFQDFDFASRYKKSDDRGMFSYINMINVQDCLSALRRIRFDKYCEWIVNKYVIYLDNDCMMFGNESTRNKINKIKQYYIVVLILHSCLLSMWYVLFITKWDIRKREDFFKFYTVTISYNGTQFSWFCKFLEMFNI